MSSKKTSKWFHLTVVAAVTGAATAAWGDEDLRKLKDRQPPVYHGGYMGGVWGEGPDGDFESQNVRLLSWLPLNLFPNGPHSSANTCWGYVSPSGREYMLIGLQRGTGVVEVTDPVNPVILGVVTGPTSTWRDMKVIGEYAYAVSEGGSGIQVIDLRNVDSGQIRHVGNIQQNGHTTTHTIASNPDSGFLYLCGARVGNDGLVAVSTANPENPTIVGAWSGMYVHEAQVVTYHTGPYAGREIAFCYSGSLPSGFSNGGLRIIDVTDKGNMHLIGQLFWPSTGYAHQGWLSEDGRFVYINDELDEQNFSFPTRTRIANVEDLTNPTYVGFFSTGLAAVDHNLYVLGDRIFEANYRSGLQIFSTSENGGTPTAPVRIGYFDTYPGSDSAQFNGAWNNYPFFPSGNIAISDIERGLFMVRYDSETMSINLVGSAPTTLAPNQATPVAIEVVAGGGAEIDAVALNVIIDGGMPQEIQMTNQGGDEYGAAIPGTSCFSNVDFWFTVRSASGGVFNYPTGGQNNAYAAVVATGQAVAMHDNFQTNMGWIGEVLGATAGQWDRGVPVNDPQWAYAPVTDSDGSGACLLTDNRMGNSDVDDGSVRITSPTIDMSSGSITISYDYYLNLTNTNGADMLLVEINTNNGTGAWTEIARHTSNGARNWRPHIVDAATLAALNVTPTAQTKVRFTANDANPQSVVEAGIDAFRVVGLECQECYADCDPSTGVGVLDIFDFLCFGNLFDQGDPYACDCDTSTGPAVCDIFDFLCFGNAFDQGCP